jgi:hypothetical protein
VGVEHPDDIIADIRQALEVVTKSTNAKALSIENI